MSQWLSPEEVADLTGYVQPSRQRRWFDSYQIRYRQSGSGRPIVRRDDLDPTLRRPDEAEPPRIPVLDEEAAYRPLSELRARRQPYRLNDGPSDSGIYFLFFRWALVYVGQSVNPRHRLHTHWLERAIPFNGYSFLAIPQYWMNRVEFHYIREFQPRCNRKWR